MQKIRFAAFAVLVAIGLTGCAAQDRFAAGAEKVRATKPLVDWVDVKPEHLADVDPKRLGAEGVALVIVRSVRESAAGERTGVSAVITLRDVATSTMRVSPVQQTGNESEVGWAILFVPPGQYAVNRGAYTRRTAVSPVTGDVRDSIVDSKGHPFVPLGSTVRIGAGDIVYAGTVVWQAKGPSTPVAKVSIRDERTAAATWARTNLPGFAPQMQTKLLPPPVQPLS